MQCRWPTAEICYLGTSPLVHFIGFFNGNGMIFFRDDSHRHPDNKMLQADCDKFS